MVTKENVRNADPTTPSIRFARSIFAVLSLMASWRPKTERKHDVSTRTLFCVIVCGRDEVRRLLRHPLSISAIFMLITDLIPSRPQQQSLRPGGAPAYSLSDSMFPNVIFCEIFIMGRSLDDRFHVDSGSDRVFSPRKTRIRWTRSSLYPRSHLIHAERQLFQTLIGAVTPPVPRHP